MSWIVLGLIGIALLGGMGVLFLRRRREGRLTLDGQTVRCPVDDCQASLTVRADFGRQPGRRYVDVTACSLQPSVSFLLPPTTGYLPDVPAHGQYVREVGQASHHHAEVTCAKPCLLVLNAADRPVAAEEIRCSSGVSDGLELVRQTQGSAMMRQLWFHSS